MSKSEPPADNGNRARLARGDDPGPDAAKQLLEAGAATGDVGSEHRKVAKQRPFAYPFPGATVPPWSLGMWRRLLLEAKYRFRRQPSPRPSEVRIRLISPHPQRLLTADELPLLFLVRNDRRYLPSFLRHYRDMGVTRFICVDDRSSDGGREYLLDQSDVDVYDSNMRYAEAARGKIWREQLFDRYGYDRWYVNVDSDEYLIYETVGEESALGFARRLRKHGIYRLPATMLDMYPIAELNQARFDGAADVSPWDVATHFDGCGYQGWLQDKGLDIRGGVRSRLFGSEMELVKYPLVYWDRYCSLGRSIHKPLPGKYGFPPALGVLLHFNIFADLHEHVALKAAEGQHFRGSQHYRRLLSQLDVQMPATLHCEHSLPYRGPRDLISRGFMLPLVSSPAARQRGARSTETPWKQTMESRSTVPTPDTTPLPISAFIICLNEEQYLANCLESLRQCAEIIVVDSGSTDGTAALVQRYIDGGWPIKFLYEKWRGYAAQKQYALSQCTLPWCLSIDADERLDESLRQELPRLIDAPEEVVAWRLARRPYLIGYGYTPRRVQERRILRLIRRGRGAFDLSLKVHEGIVPDGTVRDAKTGSLLHYRPLPIEEQILKENKYSSLKADQLIEKGQGPRLAKLFFNPPLYFYRLYFHNGLYRCGIPGFIQAATGAVYSFLTESKLYQKHAELRRPSFDDMEGTWQRPAQAASDPSIEQQRAA